MNHPLNFTSLDSFSDLDHAFARFIGRFGGGEIVETIAASLSRAVRQGHLCLDLASPTEEVPPLDEARCALAVSRAVGVGGDEATTPLVLDSAGRLYLRRYYEYEQSLAAALKERAGAIAPCGEGQEAAVEAALAGRLAVISGGPGTGKTTTAVTILQRLMESDPGTRIALAAPTGKAAARLEEAIRDGFAKLVRTDLSAALERLPRAKTLEGLLGARPGSAAIRHHAGNPLAVDVLLVDEASMIALPLMAKLFAALPHKTRVVLLGDRDQLASVAPGSVLADLAEGLPVALVMLRRNYRFGNESAIFRLCEAIREGDAGTALKIVGQATGEAWPDLGGAPLPASADTLAARLRGPVLEGYGEVVAERDPERALAAFSRFRILCALRRGPYGVEGLNRQIETLLREAGLIRGHGPQHAFYAGMPVLITRNDYQLNLMNGTIGILLPDPNDPEPVDGSEKPLWGWFPGEGKETGLRRIAPARLPDYEPAYAMTVHKSQGSEFERVLLLLPDRDAPVITRELIYTGLTRARSRVEVWFDPELFEQGVARKTQRASGLREALGHFNPV